MSRQGDGRYYQDRGRDAYSGSQRGYDRSRSRDGPHHDRRFPQGGQDRRPRYGAGGGGGAGGRYNSRPNSMRVTTNYFKIEFVSDKIEWDLYRVEIKAGIKAKAPAGSDKRFETNPDGSFKIVPKQRKGTEVGFLDIEKSSITSRRILEKLSREIYDKKRVWIVADGGAMAYSAKDFLEPPRSVSQTFPVSVKRDCGEDEDGADRVKNQWFLVTLSKVGKIYPSDTQGTGLEQVRQAMDIIFRGTMINAGLTSFGKSPRVFHFPEKDQRELLSGSVQMNRLLDRERNYMPLLGLLSAVRHCENGNKFLNLDTIIDYANREYLPPTPARKYKVPLLDVEKGELCGVRLGNLNRPINDPETRRNIEKAMMPLNINIEYRVPPKPEWRKKMLEKGLTEAEIEKKSKMVFRNKRMRLDEKTQKSIVWNANDPDQYSFEYAKKGKEDQAPVRVTVPQYFREQYGINLRFPQMPLVHVGKGNWYPVEFLNQAFSKTRDANSDTQKNAVLDFNDRHAGLERVSVVKKALGKLRSYGVKFDDIMSQFNIRIYCEPVEVTAKVLKMPELKFANQTARINNGAWNLRDTKFFTPAEITSFAVMDLSEGRAAEDFITTITRVATSHGMKMPQRVNVKRLISCAPRTSDTVAAVQQAVYDAIGRAKTYFLQLQLFKTRVRNPNGGFTKCLVMGDTYNGTHKTYGIVLPRIERQDTHYFTYKGREMYGRLVMRGQNNKICDPFDFPSGYNDQDLLFETLPDRSADIEIVEYISKAECQNIRHSIEVEEYTIECPALVICLLPDNKAEKYGLVKMFCHFQYGVQCQCIVSSKYTSQKRKEQYCSNVALKINAKMSNMDNTARGWTTTSTELHKVGVTWINEVPTMVLGISMSNSLGHGDDIVSVISVSASLDDGCMKFAQEVRICTKTEVIPDSILSNLVKALFLQYYLHNNRTPPQRILAYRDGVSEGSFPQVRKWEIQSLRTGYFSFAKESGLVEKDTPEDMFNGPLITYIACMSRNNVKIVPSDRNAGEKNNVFSGTCVDEQVIDNLAGMSLHGNDRTSISDMQNRGYLYSEPEGSGYDFLLTAHGGLKGTSKPVQYRIILNENAVFRPNNPNATPLTKSKLEQATYEMSFQYSTATKAVRLVPAVYYSARYSETVLKYFSYLKNQGAVEKVKLDDTGLEIIGRDGAPKPRFVYVRKEFLESTSSPQSIQDSTILKAFSPITKAEGGGLVHYVAPFTHISA